MLGLPRREPDSTLLAIAGRDAPPPLPGRRRLVVARAVLHGSPSHKIGNHPATQPEFTFQPFRIIREQALLVPQRNGDAVVPEEGSLGARDVDVFLRWFREAITWSGRIPALALDTAEPPVHPLITADSDALSSA